jgi:ABC-2 type transport system permease protein
MSTIEAPPQPPHPLVMVVADSLAVMRRNVIKIKRVPDVLVFATLSPIMFILMFGYVFGGAISVPGSGTGAGYREFLVAGIFVQTVVFGATWTGASIAEDLQKGMIDRFRSLPMAKSAVLIGRTTADVGINVVTIVIMSLTGLAIGWRIRTSVLEAALGFLILLLFAFAISWIMATVGLLVRTPEVVNNASFMVIFPLTFVANTFVPDQSLPAGVRQFAEWNPVSAITQAGRELFGNIPAGAPRPTAWPLQHPELYSLLWVAVILVVFVPLSVRLYQRATTR